MTQADSFCKSSVKLWAQVQSTDTLAAMALRATGDGYRAAASFVASTTSLRAWHRAPPSPASLA